MWKGHLTSGAFVKDNVKLVFDDERKDHSSPGTPTIVVRGVDGLSLDPNYAPEEERTNQNLGLHSAGDKEITGKRWGGGLDRNEICVQLNAIVET